MNFGWHGRSGVLFEGLGAGEEPSVDDLAVDDFVGDDEVDCAGAFGEGAGDAFVVHHEAVDEDAVEEVGVEIGFLKAECEAGADLRVAGGEEGGGVFEQLSVLGVGGEEGVDFVRVVGVELTLNEVSGGGVHGSERIQGMNGTWFVRGFWVWRHDVGEAELVADAAGWLGVWRCSGFASRIGLERVPG